MMLRRFVYLDEELLDQFIAQVEDGLRAGLSRTQSKDSTVEGGGDLKIAKLGGSKTSGDSETLEYSDSPHARFNRLLELVKGHEDEFRWVEALQDADLESLTRGSTIDVAADLYESDVTKVTGPNGVLGLLPLVAKMQQGIASFKTAADSLPGVDQLEAISAFGNAMPESILYGDVGDSDWRIVCVLPALKDVEGETQVVGKVVRVIPAGKHEPLPGVPFIEQMPRPQRRAFVQAGPKKGQEMLWVSGPAIVVDVLALYR